MRIWDISAGRTFSILLGDRDKNKTDVFFCGAMERLGHHSRPHSSCSYENASFLLHDSNSLIRMGSQKMNEKAESLT